VAVSASQVLGAMTIGFDRAVGCYPERLSEAERSAPVVPDQFQHEVATAFNLKGRGLVVLTSCSHRGVVNAIRQAQAASGVERIHAVIGGFHLAPIKRITFETRSRHCRKSIRLT
jgi:7,8-dihydropterin-6-yl-methyl-4-(beta-D-ribofuranosyl)aminobenzene 5'-phosphate synthase